MKKKIKEMDDYEVVVGDDDNNINPVKKKSTVVTAPSAAQAISTGTTPQERMGGDKIMVKKKDPKMGVGGGSSGGVLSEGPKAPRFSSSKLSESLDYPYSIFVPGEFHECLKSAGIPSRLTGVGVTGRVSNSKQMVEALNRLKKNSDPRSNVILRGIVENSK